MLLRSEVESLRAAQEGMGANLFDVVDNVRAELLAERPASAAQGPDGTLQEAMERRIAALEAALALVVSWQGGTRQKADFCVLFGGIPSLQRSGVSGE